jgi:hypothetical protein
MKPVPLFWVSCILFLLVATSPIGTSAGPGKTVLRSETQSGGDSILLANLLPENASQELRRLVGNISLGISPQPGTTRRLPRSTVLSIIQTSGLEADAFKVPEAIDIRRVGRTLTREEVFSTIQTFLAANPLAAVPAFGPEDIRFESSISVSETITRLHVTQFAFDRLLGQMRFRLCSRAKPLILPFYVTVNVPTSRGGVRDASFPLGPMAELPSAIVLVDPRRTAQLRLHSANSEATIQVQPLVPGHLGEIIPVRLLASRKTLKARVVGRGSLDISF